MRNPPEFSEINFIARFSVARVSLASIGVSPVRFAVANTAFDGTRQHKSNSNFFDLRDGRFSHIRVYMAGGNTRLAR